MKRNIHNINATDKILGRLATKIAILLRGKQRSDFAPNKDIEDLVVVKNVAELKVTGRKMEQKKYFQHSGYLGSLKETPLKILFKKDPAQVLRKAVFGMLPKNRLRAKIIKRLKFNSVE